MPPVSEAQRRAMFAAKAGKSTIGIPQKVGAEFAKADSGGKLPGRVTHGKAAEKEMERMEREAKGTKESSESKRVENQQLQNALKLLK